MSEVQASENLIRKVQVTIDPTQLKQETTKRLQKLASQMKLSGFRPGKVPASMAERLHGAAVRDEAIEITAQEAFWKMVSDQKLRVAGSISVNKDPSSSEDKIVCTIEYETFPEITTPDFANVSLDRFSTSISDTDVEETIDNMRQSKATYQEISRPAAKKDRLTIDFIGRLEGTPFEGGTATDYPFVLGQGGLLPEFEQAVEGMNVGENKKFPLTFPENYGAKDLAGKQVEFEVTLKKIEEPQLPELNDSFASQFDVIDGVEGLKKRVRENMEREVKNRLYSKNRDTVFAWLGEQIKVTLPESLVKADMRQLHQEFVERMKSQMGGQKISPSQFAHLPPELFRDKAQERVRLGLALRHIEDTQKLEPQSTAIEEEIQSRASLYDKPEEFIEWVKKDARQMEELKSFVLEKALVEWIFSQVSENKKELSFKELLANQTAST